MKVCIVTDSNSGIGVKEGKELGIIVIPMPFFIDGETFYEEISLSQERFYELLAQDKDVSTSQPAIGEVTDLWDNLLKEYDQIVHIPMSSGLSMSCQTALSFASEEPYLGKVFVVDNCRISVTQRQSVLDALELVNKGYNGEQIKDYLEIFGSVSIEGPMRRRLPFKTTNPESGRRRHWALRLPLPIWISKRLFLFFSGATAYTGMEHGEGCLSWLNAGSSNGEMTGRF